MKHLIHLLIASAVCIIAAPVHAAATSAKPNFLILLADDLGYGDVQCYNPQRGKIPTPNIDKLAAQGMRFTDGHSSSGVCSPSRYALLTGRYHWRSRLQVGIVDLFEKPLIAPERMTIGTLAKQHGYHTAAIGKWHLGWDWPLAQEQRKYFQKAGQQGINDEAAVATDDHLAAWRDVFAKPIAGGPTTRGSINTSAPMCRIGRRFVSSRTTARSAPRASSCPAS
jgi:arylsulfatase A-like enzyme